MYRKNITALALGTTLVMGLLATTVATDADAAFKAPYAAGNFELSLDGVAAGFVSRVDGGTMVSDAISEAATRGAFVKKHATAPRFDPLVVTVAPSKPWVDWINASLGGRERARSGALAFFDQNFKELGRRSFTNLRLAEVAFPEVNAAEAKKNLEVKLTMLGDSATEVKGTGAAAVVPMGNRKTSSTNNFKITIPGLDATRVVKVTELVAKTAGAPVLLRGEEAAERKFPATSTRAEVSNFSVFLQEAGAESWKAWFQSFVINGKNGDAEEKTMTIEILNPALTTVVFRVRLEGVGIVGLAPSILEPNSSTGRQLQADMYAESIFFEDTTAAPTK